MPFTEPLEISRCVTWLPKHIYRRTNSFLQMYFVCSEFSLSSLSQHASTQKGFSFFVLCFFANALHPSLLTLRIHLPDDWRTKPWSSRWIPCHRITTKVRRSSTYTFPCHAQYDNMTFMWIIISFRFMVKHLTGLLTSQGEAADPQRSNEGAVFDNVKEKFPLIIFSCVQLASKMSLHSHVSSAMPAIKSQVTFHSSTKHFWSFTAKLLNNWSRSFKM